MHECCGEEDTRAEMTYDEEEGGRDAERFEANSKQRERTGGEGGDEDEEEAADVDGEVVVCFICAGAAGLGSVLGH